MRIATAFALSLLALSTVVQSSAQSTASSKPTATAKAVHVNEGQHVFEQNCSRCHNPPDGFSPRISSTVVRHMRVRANLSEADAKALMKFFHP